MNFLLVDSSSYGISAAFLGMILSSSARMANDSSVSTSAWVKAIYGELKATLGEEGHFSVFFGRLNRRDFTLHYQLFGSIEAYCVRPDGTCFTLEKNGKAVSSRSGPSSDEEHVVSLAPRERIVLLSDGFVKGVGGEFALHQVFQGRLKDEPFAVVNDLSFQNNSLSN